MVGSPISFTTVYGHGISGWITNIKNDSVFVKMYDVRTLPTQFGTTVVDTVGSYLANIAFKDIARIDLAEKESFGFIKNGTIFIIGGLGYAALNVINGAYLKEPITDSKNLTSLGIALGVAGGGYLLNRIHHHKQKNGNNYKIEYVSMNNPSVEKARKSF